MKKYVLVVGDPSHTQTAHQIQLLRSTKAQVLIVDPQNEAAPPQISWSETSVQLNGQPLNPKSITSVLIRTLPQEFPAPSSFLAKSQTALNWEQWFYEYCLQRDRHDTIVGFLLYLESLGIPFYNPPSKTHLSRRKPFQLQKLRAAGCLLPETLITNDPGQASEFISTHSDVIAKPAAGGALTLSANTLSRENLEKIKVAPAIFQRRIYGRDLRVMVLNEQVISCAAIDVPANTLDFRGNPTYQDGNITYTEVDLPEDILQLCTRATASVGLQFAGVDIKLTNGGEYYFLECNSSPIYLDVELKLNHPITQALALKLASPF